MIQHGNAPFLECSSKGDRRFSAFYARVRKLGNKTIEELYQTIKDVDNIPDWRSRKGVVPKNTLYATAYYSMLWDMYIDENIKLLPILHNATGLSDMFGQYGHVNQATELWRIRNELAIRVLITGDRNWTEKAPICAVLEKLQTQYKRVILIHGAARGADTIADTCARELNIHVWSFPALWGAFKHAGSNEKYAGMFRNHEMLVYGQPHIVFAFHDDLSKSKGTKNMVKRAQLNNVRVYLVDSKGNI